jgi:hypothetical protein
VLGKCRSVDSGGRGDPLDRVALDRRDAGNGGDDAITDLVIEQVKRDRPERPVGFGRYRPGLEPSMVPGAAGSGVPRRLAARRHGGVIATR